MERFHVQCEAGENLEITSKDYLSLLLSYRHKIQNEATKYNTYNEWKEEWDSSRKKHIFTIGNTGDTYGNSLLKLVPTEYGSYSLKIADYKNGVERGTYDEFTVYLSYLEEIVRETVTTRKTISYYIVKEKGRFYIKPIVEIQGNPKTEEIEGCYGLDINNGFISVTKTTKKGKFVSTEDIIFEGEGSKKQNVDSLTKVILAIHQKAKEENYGVAIEGINLTRKKIVTHSKKMNRILHLFPYTRYIELNKRISKIGTHLYLVHSAYTSQIDDRYKEALKISRHQSAAFVIA